MNERLALILDTGAFTSFIGAHLARALGVAAAEHGHEVSQIKLANPMQMRGVGHGTETCRYALRTVLAIEHADNHKAHLHEWTAPILKAMDNTCHGS